MARQGHYHYESMRTARALAVLALLFAVLSAVLVPFLVSAGGYSLLAMVGLVSLTLGVAFAAFDRAPDAGWLFEYDTRRKFRAVCDQKNLSTKDDAGRPVYPRFSRLIGGQDAWHVRIHPLLGQSVPDWERAAPAFVLAFAAVGVRFSDNGDGTLMMKAGYQRLEAREFVPNQAEVFDGAGGWRERLALVVVGTTESGHPYALPLLDSHILVAGITGSGKGSVIWSLILGLQPACRAGVVRFWGFDPKKMELSIGRNFFGSRYAADPEAMVELLEQAVAVMMTRANELSGKVRRFDPSELHPVHVLVIDELGYLSSLLPDRKLRERADKALSAILVLGRAVGFVVVGALQDPRKATLEYRDLFPTRVAMRLPKPMVDLVLGHGAHEAGALCDLIPAGSAGAGVAFVLGEGATVPRCVRMTWCSDDLISRVAGALTAPAAPRIAS